MCTSMPQRSWRSWTTSPRVPGWPSWDVSGWSRNWPGATSGRPTSASTGAWPPPTRPGTEMCGIAGCYQQADGHKLVEIMTDRIAHRGPDATGIWDHDDDLVAAQLGHRRLSIIDLSSAADQPLSKHGMVLVYN